MGGQPDAKMRVTKYYASVHYGICHGPLDYISAIIVNEKEAWTGQQSAQGSINIDKQALFGGTKKEGGVAGIAEYLSGGPAQTIPEVLAAKAGRTTATMPAYRGIASVWFHDSATVLSDDRDDRPGFYWSANSPYLPGVWITAARASTALNEVHARIYRVSTEYDDVFSDTSSGWKYLQVSLADAVDRSAKTFDDSGWPTGQMPFRDAGAAHPEAVAEGFSGTQNTDWQNDTKLWLRKAFTVETIAPIAIDLFVDDYATVWVNGTQVLARTNFYASYPPTATSVEITIPASVLVDGENVIAILCEDQGSSRTYAAVKLIGVFGEFDSNPAHIIYECLTNTSWGMGAPSSAIDVASFEAAAATLYDEDFGLSMIWTRQTTIEAFISEVLDHIEAVLFVSPRTGLLTLKLIRNDYSVTGLPEFTPDNSVVTKFGRKLWGETINEIVVTWTNPASEEEETVVAQDLANIAAQGGIVSDSRNYYGVRVKDLAMRLAQRDLRAGATPLASCDIEVNREAWDLLPGDVVILDSPEDGIEALVMRVGPVDYGQPGDGTVKASLVEDVWALALADYTVPPDTAAEDTSELPTPADYTLILTASYWSVLNGIDPAISDIVYPEVFAGVLATEDGPDTIDFDLYGEVVDAGGNTTVEDIGTKTITSRSELPDPLVAEVESIIFDFGTRTRGNGPSVGGFVLLEGADETEHELCLILAFDDTSPTSWTLRRGVLDTIPKAWPVGTPVWFIDDSSIWLDQTVRAAGETVNYQILPRTSMGQLAIGDAPIVSETLTGRPHLPSRPAGVTIDLDDGFSGSIDLAGVDPIPVAFARRNRLTEDTLILAWDDGDVTPEAGQTTTVRLTDIDNNVVHEYTGIAGTSQNVDPADFGDISQGYIIVTAVRDSLESLQPYRVHVILSYAFEFEDGDIFEFEDGERKEFEDL